MAVRSQPIYDTTWLSDVREKSRSVSRVLSDLSIGSSHSSRTRITARLKRPTQIQREQRYRISIWSCSGRGLPCRSRYRSRGALLPHHFTLTCAPARKPAELAGGILSVALSVGSRRPGVTWRRAPGVRTFLLDRDPGDCSTGSFPGS